MPAHCPSCGSAGVTAIGDIPSTNIFCGIELDRTIPGGVLYRCADYHLHFRDPRMGKAALDALYSSLPATNWQYTDKIRADWQAIGALIRSRVCAGAVLDIGCWDGGFLAGLPGDYEKYGVELNREAARRATQNGVRVVARDMAGIDEIADRYDVVVATDTIEHVHDPLRLLDAMRNLVRPGGWIMLSTGNPEALSWRFMGSRYWYCALAEHLSFVGPSWCRRAAQRLDLELEAVLPFRYKAAGIGKASFECAENVCYRLFPSVYHFLRLKTGKPKPSRLTDARFRSPPRWATSKDHFVAVFRSRPRPEAPAPGRGAP